MGIFSKDEEPSWSDVIHLEKQVKELKAENERLKECNEELTSDNLNTIQEMDNERRRVEQLKQDIEAYKQSEQEASEIIAELKEEVRQLQRRNPEEIYTLFGRPIKYWEQLEQENEKLKAENKKLKQDLEIALREENRWKSNYNNYRDALRVQYKTLQDIKELAKGLINGSIGGCEDDIGYKLQKIITKAESEG